MTTMHWSVTLCDIGSPLDNQASFLQNCSQNTKYAVVGNQAKRANISRRLLETLLLFALHPTTTHSVLHGQCNKLILGAPMAPYLTQGHRPKHGSHQIRNIASTPPVQKTPSMCQDANFTFFIQHPIFWAVPFTARRWALA